MKKRLISLFCAIVIAFSLALPAFAATPEEQYKNLNDIADYIKQHGLNSSPDDDPVKRGLIELFKNNPTAYDALMDSMLRAYDRYSNFVAAGNYDVSYPTNTSYVGIGVTLEQDGANIKIAAVSEGGSAQRAGVLPGDIIEIVGGQNVVGMTIDQVSPLLRGDEGTKVAVTVNRGGNKLAFTLSRIKIVMENFESRLLEDGVYYMKIARFAETTSYLKFVVAIREMAAQQTKSLIIDVRGNPGGEVDMALNMLNRLIPDANKTFFSIGSRNGGAVEYESFTSDGIGPRLNKIIILCDNGSASASEILQSSLVDLGYAEAVGQTTYGKARGQYHLVFDDGSAVVLTGLELRAPSGVDYDTVGLKPKYPVANSTKAHPAASCEKITERFLNITNNSEDTGKLNRALIAMGFLSLDKADDINDFGAKTRDALNEFRGYYGRAEQSYLDVETAKLINQRLTDFANQSVVEDKQMEQALVVAREYAKFPLQYTLDKDGNFKNIIK